VPARDALDLDEIARRQILNAGGVQRDHDHRIRRRSFMGCSNLWEIGHSVNRNVPVSAEGPDSLVEKGAGFLRCPERTASSWGESYAERLSWGRDQFKRARGNSF